MGSEKFSLKWNDFESTVSCSLGEIREAGELLDVTIACAEDQIKAHRLIISACSPLLRSIVNRSPQQANPFIYLKGIRFSDLTACLDFMYNGEVNVAQENLNSFLSAAEELQVRGLTQEVSQGSANKKETARKEKTHHIPAVTTSHKEFKEESPKKRAEVQGPSTNPIKHEPREVELDHAPTNTMVTEYAGMEDYQEDDFTDYNNEDLDYKHETADFQAPLNKDSGLSSGLSSGLGVDDLGQYVNVVNDMNVKEYQCGLCDTFRAKLPSKVRNHLEAIHFPGVFLYTCNVCDKTLKGRNALNIHKSTMHSRKLHVSQQE